VEPRGVHRERCDHAGRCRAACGLRSESWRRSIPLGLPDDLVVFYEISRWDQRKNTATSLRAFLEAFTIDDRVAFVLKAPRSTNLNVSNDWVRESSLTGSTMLEVARIIRSYPRPPLVRLEVDSWSQERIAGLHARGDCFTSLTHGEGWHIGAFDAAAYGNPVVMTGWSGQLAYLEPDNSYLVDYDLEPAEHDDALTYSPDQRWATPRFDHAVERLREVAADIGAAQARAAPQRERVLHDYAGPRQALHERVITRELFEAVRHDQIGPAVADVREHQLLADQQRAGRQGLQVVRLGGVDAPRPAADRHYAAGARVIRGDRGEGGT